MYTVINASGVSFELPNGRQLFSEVSFSLNTQLTALVGPNGIGKTTLARLIAGELEPTTGHIQRYGAVTYFPQREEPPSISVIEYLGDTYEWSTLIESLLKDIDLGQACTDLSGGQWMRVRLSRIINGQYLILDEPTNDLDREGRALIFSFIQNRHGGSLIISHDRECLHVCDEILELSNRGLKIFGGSWETYLNSKNHERENLEK
ncbi:MAG: ATP-binding cassette domain-containing protein, partial [Bdellovibrionota bacterium]